MDAVAARGSGFAGLELINLRSGSARAAVFLTEALGHLDEQHVVELITLDQRVLLFAYLGRIALLTTAVETLIYTALKAFVYPAAGWTDARIGGRGQEQGDLRLPVLSFGCGLGGGLVAGLGLVGDDSYECHHQNNVEDA